MDITLTSFNLSWLEAQALALAGALVRREDWTFWTAYRNDLWWIYDRSPSPLRVVTAGDFLAADYHATDWTTDPISTVRNVCSLPPPTMPFSAPSVSVTVTSSSTITVHLGSGTPSGSYQLQISINGTALTFPEVTDNSVTTVSYSMPLSGVVNAQVIVVSRLPLPSWTGYAFATMTFVPSFSVASAADGTTVTLAYNAPYVSLSYVDGNSSSFGYGTHSISYYVPANQSAGVTITNPFTIPVTLTISGHVNDDLLLNGVVYQPDSILPLFFPSNPAGHRNGAHNLACTTTLAAGASLLIQGQDNGLGGWLNCAIVVSI